MTSETSDAFCKEHIEKSEQDNNHFDKIKTF